MSSDPGDGGSVRNPNGVDPTNYRPVKKLLSPELIAEPPKRRTTLGQDKDGDTCTVESSGETIVFQDNVLPNTA